MENAASAALRRAAVAASSTRCTGVSSPAAIRSRATLRPPPRGPSSGLTHRGSAGHRRSAAAHSHLPTDEAHFRVLRFAFGNSLRSCERLVAAPFDQLQHAEHHLHARVIRSDPQDVVNRQIGEYDLFVGILWNRMGTPTAVATSGTEEEFQPRVWTVAAEQDVSRVALLLSAAISATAAQRRSRSARQGRWKGSHPRMRALALAAHTLVPELAASTSPGHLLAAVTMLQAVPRPEFLTWLAQRLGIEKPFVGYHAAMALLSSVRALRVTHSEKLRAALALVKEQFTNSYRGAGGDTTDRYRLLEEMEKELDRPSTGTAPMQR